MCPVAILRSTNDLNKPILYSVTELVPTDGVPKGKTWGPSTLHSRERSHLPALTQTTSQEPPQFSKSAPNLDKSRIAAANNLPANASSSHNNILGTLADDLNFMHTGTVDAQSYSNSTELGSADRLNNNNPHNDSLLNGDRYTIYDYDEDDDDDDDTEKTGCFSFIGVRGDDSYMKRKKHSLDSRMTETSPENSLHIAVKTIGASAHAAPHSQPFDGERSDDAPPTRNADDPPYDRVFYRTIQKSLDDIFGRDDFNDQFTAQNSRHSKSSADLTMYSDSEHHYRFQPFGSSKFSRDCFIVNKNNGPTADRDGSSSDTDDLDSSNHELSTRSNDSISENISNSLSQSEADPFGDRSAANSVRSIRQKSPVTFRVDSTDSTQSIGDSPTELFYVNVVHGSVRESFVYDDPAAAPPSKRASQRFSVGPEPTALTAGALLENETIASAHQPKVAPKRLNSDSRPYSKFHSNFKAIQRFWRAPRNGSVLHSNSFYKKQDAKTEMNEQLLDDDNEPKYETFRTRNFLLAKKKDGN